MRSSGSGRRNQTTFMTFTAISGIAGLTRMAPLEKAYGYQLGVKHQYKEGMMDQVDRVLYDLKNNPYSRRIMTNIYVHEDLHEMNLYPCAYSMTFNVTKEPGKDKLTLNAILNQRSQDILAANNWNVCQYSLLLMMIAQCCDMEAGELVTCGSRIVIFMTDMFRLSRELISGHLIRHRL